MGRIGDDAIIYQLEKIDSGGAVQDLFEYQISDLAEALGYETELNEDSAWYGDIKLPDGRHAGLRFEAFITTQEEEEEWRLTKARQSPSETEPSSPTE